MATSRLSDFMDQTGYFLFSLDTELAWGYFDLDEERSEIFSADGSKERELIRRLLDVLNEFGIVATWGIIGHLFFERCEECEICPILEWQGRYRSFEEIYKTDEPLWYGADVIELLLTEGARHEIAFHGYTHRLFGEISENEAKIEIQEWLRLGSRKGIAPQAFIFPRNVIGHLDLFRRAGFICYRGEEKVPRLYKLGLFGKLLKNIDYTLSLSTSPVYKVDGVGAHGMVNLPASQYFYGYHSGWERVLDSLNLHKLRIRRMIKGVKKAADEQKIFHLWAHPWEFRTEKDFEKLRYLLNYVADEMDKGRLRSITMTDLARAVIEQRESDSP